MDLTSIAKLSTTIAETGNNQDVALAMLKKQQDLQQSAADQILGGITQPQRLPAHLGNTINTTA